MRYSRNPPRGAPSLPTVPQLKELRNDEVSVTARTGIGQEGVSRGTTHSPRPDYYLSRLIQNIGPVGKDFYIM